ncbi:MAG: hypothetical protein QF486_00670 [Candidatus Woesearchaeota archaeon]|jgi:hypothetical protein|nr:hypothetical protein [Candidatus Woesearchaeota archaeon]MDP7181267.1 hypothetical protein [Candidatus Woesearchaeota archaeon]MDP7198114.1 hypothetical protein [Candidatus Woesearchaeota archaeon]MDP7466948.1 hypothetical protein [Candidatus Woesearchaeota archaeon]MDP7646967.1 hypothetical protein [Candidatus Woesearchaeota archaeon]|tara:strand:+ start:91 stop:531 length:441 start_codon:yes stop_codon:yes gene_type:complete
MPDIMLQMEEDLKKDARIREAFFAFQYGRSTKLKTQETVEHARQLFWKGVQSDNNNHSGRNYAVMQENFKEDYEGILAQRRSLKWMIGAGITALVGIVLASTSGAVDNETLSSIMKWGGWTMGLGGVTGAGVNGIKHAQYSIPSVS